MNPWNGGLPRQNGAAGLANVSTQTLKRWIKLADQNHGVYCPGKNWTMTFTIEQLRAERDRRKP